MMSQNNDNFSWSTWWDSLGVEKSPEEILAILKKRESGVIPQNIGD